MPTVLVIDGNPSALDTIGRALRGAGFSVVFAATGGEGVTLASRLALDLVVADLRLGDIAGIEVLRRLRQNRSRVPIILTGIDSPAAAIEAGRLGTTDYLEKPIAQGSIVDLARFRVCTQSHAVETASAHESSPWVIGARRAIDERYADARLNVRLVARELGVSTEHLCRLVKKHTGETFASLVRRSRLQAATRLLLTTNLSMKEIAASAGFSSASRFDRDFKREHGVPPTEYRVERRRRA
jgi:YesN/AraC family two-component response regulator